MYNVTLVPGVQPPCTSYYGRKTANKCRKNNIVREPQFWNPNEMIVPIKDHQRMINVKCHWEMHGVVFNMHSPPQFPNCKRKSRS